MTKDLKNQINSLPHHSGVYFFKNKNEEIVYIGKAIDLMKRVKSHFAKTNKLNIRLAQPVAHFYNQVKNIDYIETPSEKDALILERKLVRQYQPKFNVELRDDKDFLYIVFTNDKYPKIITTHQPKKYLSPSYSRPSKSNLRQSDSNPRKSVSLVGPLIDTREAKNLLTKLRRLFPYRTCGAQHSSNKAKSAEASAKEDNNSIDKPCLYYHLGLCYAHNKESKKYPLVIKGLETILRLYSQDWKLKNLYPRKSVLCPAVVLSEGGLSLRKSAPLLECYDISNTNGTTSVGSMVAFKGNKPYKKLYRKFKIKTVEGANDPSSLREIITRRLSHTEWGTPDLIVVDGGKSQLSMLKDIKIPVVGLAKLKYLNKNKRSKFDGYLYSQFSSKPLRLNELPEDLKNTFLAIRDEAHRFAITFHRKSRVSAIK